MRLLRVQAASPPRSRRARGGRLGDRPQRADLGRREAAARRSSSAVGQRAALERRDARLEPAEDRARARHRHLLRHDDRGEARKSRFAAAQRRRTADGEHPLDEFGVLRSKRLDGRVEARFVGDRRAGTVDPRGGAAWRGLRAASACASVLPSCSRPFLPLRPSSFRAEPNGALHLGHAYSALINQRRAEETGGALLLRIEDLDRARCKAALEDAVRAELRWLGVGFAQPPRRQSEHGADYAADLARLEAMGLLYPCFCSRAEVALAAAGRDRTAPRSIPAGAARWRRASGGRVSSAATGRRGGSTWAAPSPARRRVSSGSNRRKRRGRASPRRARGLGRRRPQGAGPRRELSPGGDRRRRASGRDRRRPRPRPPGRDVGPSPVAGSARLSRAAVSPPPSRARSAGGKLSKSRGSPRSPTSGRRESTPSSPSGAGLRRRRPAGV